MEDEQEEGTAQDLGRGFPETAERVSAGILRDPCDSRQAVQETEAQREGLGMTVRELIDKLENELTDAEKEFPIHFQDSEWGSSESQIIDYHLEAFGKGRDRKYIVVLEA